MIAPLNAGGARRVIAPKPYLPGDAPPPYTGVAGGTGGRGGMPPNMEPMGAPPAPPAPMPAIIGGIISGDMLFDSFSCSFMSVQNTRMSVPGARQMRGKWGDEE